jgi:hypothetical protein
MSAWGHRAFENDAASDWASELDVSPDLSTIEAALNLVLGKKSKRSESSVCCTALAAAEVVAALLHRPAQDLPQQVKVWLKEKPKPSSALVGKAVAVTDTILENSELKELWAETSDFDNWKASVVELRGRLI